MLTEISSTQTLQQRIFKHTDHGECLSRSCLTTAIIHAHKATLWTHVHTHTHARAHTHTHTHTHTHIHTHNVNCSKAAINTIIECSVHSNTLYSNEQDMHITCLVLILLENVFPIATVVCVTCLRTTTEPNKL